MSNMQKSFLRVNDLAREFGLPEKVAREIVTEQTRLALLHSVRAWMLLALVVAAAWWFAVSHLPTACYIMIGLGATWLVMGRVLARSSILVAAVRKAERVA